MTFTNDTATGRSYAGFQKKLSRRADGGRRGFLTPLPPDREPFGNPQTQLPCILNFLWKKSTQCLTILSLPWLTFECVNRAL